MAAPRCRHRRHHHPPLHLPNQEFIFAKAWWDPSINYIKIVPSAVDPAGWTNQLPDNEAYHIIPDSASSWTYDLKVPDAGQL
jgi:hypothetical protein